MSNLYRVTYLTRALDLCARDIESPLSAARTSKLLALTLDLTEWERDFLADLVDMAQREYDLGYRRLWRWWTYQTVRDLIDAHPHSITGSDVRAWEARRYHFA